MGNALKEDITNRYVILKPEALDPAYSDIKYHVFLAKDGFGCAPFTRGTAIIGVTPIDGEKFRVSGYDIQRFATAAEIELVAGPVPGVTTPFKNGRCLVCGHSEGDHEQFPGTLKWTCDDDCDEDLNGYCTPERAIT